MIGVVLASFLMLDLDETFSKASLGYFEDPDKTEYSKTPGRVLEGRDVLV